jgi:VanZ family protein
MLRRILLTLPSLIILVWIFIVSDQPNIELPDLDLIQLDKLLHILAYFGLGCTLAMAVEGNFRNKKKIFKILIMMAIALFMLLGTKYIKVMFQGDLPIS